MLYDIPGRTGTPITTDTLCRLAEHERIIGVKDAKGDMAETSWVTGRTDLVYYSGEDKLTLPLLSVGAVGVIGVPTHVFGPPTKAMIEAYERGDVTEALRLHHQLLPAFTGFFRTQGVIMAKAALKLLGLPGGPVRSPLVDATDDEIALLRADCAAAGVELSE
jgi:4-hydroxy-tetrahydrodipicolinate synthase